MKNPMTFPLVVVSNRLPVSFVRDSQGEKVPSLSPGGLVAAVAPSLQGQRAAWVGWDGSDSSDENRLIVDDITLFPVSVSADLRERHYEGYSNTTLWPIFHDVGVSAQFRPEWWDAYRDVNEKFASRAAEVVDEGGIVWVHDYQMMLVPAALRRLRPDVRIGYFHHIPFCEPSILRELPEFAELVAGVSGADIAGFQRDRDSNNFTQAQQDLSGVAGNSKAITYPISLDFEAVSAAASKPRLLEKSMKLRKDWGNPSTVFLGVDRIDYTKGIPERLQAFEMLLTSGAVSADDTVMVQAGSPSRENVSAYQELAARIEGIVARINAQFQSSQGRPAVVYTASNLDREDMLALFVAADVMVVSSLRDGMNLVAKEFVACDNDESGVLVLSPYTGAADRLVDALIADPTQPGELAAALTEALAMIPSERQRRMRALRDEVKTHDVAWWAGEILGDLASLARKG